MCRKLGKSRHILPAALVLLGRLQAAKIFQKRFDFSQCGGVKKAAWFGNPW